MLNDQKIEVGDAQVSAYNELHEACRVAVNDGLHPEYVNVSDGFFMQLAQQDEGQLHFKTNVNTKAPILMWNSLEVKTVCDLSVSFELITSQVAPFYKDN